uniref:DUF4339 domain-containing protein n=1 Tax=Schlesneria paludicola TaxID=360056 RepID=A0A7C2P3Y8_9PLAN
MASQWFYQVMGAELGPISSAELKRKAQQGQIQFDTPVRAAPDGKWQPAERIKGLIDPPPAAPPPPAKPKPAAAPTVTQATSDTATIKLPPTAPKPATTERTYHFAGDSSTEIAAVTDEPASGEYDFFQMVGFELALGTPLHQALLGYCRAKHLTITEVTRTAIAEHIGRKDLLERPANPEPVGLG